MDPRLVVPFVPVSRSVNIFWEPIPPAQSLTVVRPGIGAPVRTAHIVRACSPRDPPDLTCFMIHYVLMCNAGWWYSSVCTWLLSYEDACEHPLGRTGSNNLMIFLLPYSIPNRRIGANLPIFVTFDNCQSEWSKLSIVPFILYLSFYHYGGTLSVSFGFKIVSGRFSMNFLLNVRILLFLP